MGRQKDSNKLTDAELNTILGLAKFGLSKARAAKELHYTWNSVTYHVGRIRMKTGLNPLDFYDMVKLVELAKEVDVDGSN